MKIASFDIFDTCLVRKCGTPQNMLDVLSLRVFKSNVSECVRQNFVSLRRIAEESLLINKSATLIDIYDKVPQFSSELKKKEELIQLELELESQLLVPVISIREKITRLRNNGYHIVYISDMYLPSSFLKEILITYGFFKDGDCIYVSAECGAVKGDGSLFKYVAKNESLRYNDWEHFGDNKIADYCIPKKLGINAHLVEYGYNYYPQCWINKNFGANFKLSNILAGLCRSIRLSNEKDKQLDFIVDIILPYSFSLVNDWLRQAEEDGISKLYFCSRDTYHLFEIAKMLEPIYPSIESHYLYISRKSLLEGDEKALMLYLQQIGLATLDYKVGIADVRSQGWTQHTLNEKLVRYNFNQVKGFYFEMFTCNKIEYLNDYYCEVNKIYVQHNVNSGRLLSNWQLYEDYFSMNDTAKTIDYKVKNGKAYPIFSGTDDHEHSYILNAAFYQSLHSKLLEQFTSACIDMGLMRYHYELSNLAISTLTEFFLRPSKKYLPALEEFYSYSLKYGYIPYVGKLSIVKLLITNGKRNIWRRGTISNSLPQWLVNIIYLRKKL